MVKVTHKLLEMRQKIEYVLEIYEKIRLGWGKSFFPLYAIF